MNPGVLLVLSVQVHCTAQDLLGKGDLLAQACGAPGISPSLSQVELPGPIPTTLGLGTAGLSCPPGCFTNAEMLRLLLFNQTPQSLAAAALHAGDTPRTVAFRDQWSSDTNRGRKTGAQAPRRLPGMGTLA